MNEYKAPQKTQKKERNSEGESEEEVNGGQRKDRGSMRERGKEQQRALQTDERSGNNKEGCSMLVVLKSETEHVQVAVGRGVTLLGSHVCPQNQQHQ